MKFVEKKIDVSKISSVPDFHTLLKKEFGFLSLYGMNVNALIDCLSSLWFPEDEMSSFHLNKNESLILVIDGFNSSQAKIVALILYATGAVNDLNASRQRKNKIILQFEHLA